MALDLVLATVQRRFLSFQRSESPETPGLQAPRLLTALEAVRRSPAPADLRVEPGDLIALLLRAELAFVKLRKLLPQPPRRRSTLSSLAACGVLCLYIPVSTCIYIYLSVPACIASLGRLDPRPARRLPLGASRIPRGVARCMSSCGRRSRCRSGTSLFGPRRSPGDLPRPRVISAQEVITRSGTRRTTQSACPLDRPSAGSCARRSPTADRSVKVGDFVSSSRDEHVSRRAGHRHRRRRLSDEQLGGVRVSRPEAVPRPPKCRERRDSSRFAGHPGARASPALRGSCPRPRPRRRSTRSSPVRGSPRTR